MQCKLMQPIFIAASEITFKETDEGFLVEGFLISDKINQNGWMVTAEANQLDGQDFVGKPDIFFIKDGRLDHTTGDTLESSLKVQEPFRKGTMQKILGTDTGRRLVAISKIEDPEIIRRIKNKEIMWTSPAVFPRSLADVEVVPTGPNSHIHILHRYHALHRAFVDDPAYGKGETQLGLTCEGNVKECMVKLEQMKAGIGDNEIDPLRTIPLVVSKCDQTGNLIIEMKASELTEEVSKCLSHKLGPGEEPTDKDLAICFDEAREKLAKKGNSSQIAKKYGKKQMSNEVTRKEMDDIKAQMKDISDDVKKALKGQTETEEEKKKAQEEEKKIEAKKAQDEEEKRKNGKKGKHADDMTDEEKKEAKKAQEDKDKKKENEMTARIASELSVKIPLVEKYVAAKTAQKGLDEKASTELRETMLKASVDEIKNKLDDIQNFIGVTESQPTESKIGYMGSDQYSGAVDTTLEDKTTEELLREAEIDV